MKTTLAALGVALVLLPAAYGKDDKDTKAAAPAAPKKSALEMLFEQADQKLAAGDRDAALRTLREAAEQPGTAGAEAQLRLGRVLEITEVDAALDAYKAAAGSLTGAGKGEALGRMSVLQEVRITGDPAATADQAIAADEAGVWPTIALSRARSRAKKADEAKALADKAVAADGGAGASAALGFALEAQGDMSGAETAYRAAVAAEASRHEATIGLARVLRKSGRAAEAEPLLQTLLGAVPGAVDGYKESARVKSALGRAVDAMNDATIAATLADEGDADTKKLAREMAIGKAVAEARAGQADFAIQDLTALRDQNPDAADVRVGLARAYMAKRDVASASTELEKALAMAPDSGEAHFQLGYLNHVLKQDAKTALPEYEKAVALEPENTEYRTNLGAVLAELQQIERAETELGKVTATPGYQKPDAWIYLGGAYLNAKKYKEAVAALEKALALAPEVQMSNAYMAWAHFALKDAASFTKYGAKARSLGYKDARFLDNLTRVEAGEPIK
jgi:Tfp pilus assembly protein PilF